MDNIKFEEVKNRRRIDRMTGRRKEGNKKRKFEEKTKRREEERK